MAHAPLDSMVGLHVLVTGVAQGLGFLFARPACLEGATRIILWVIDEEKLLEAVEQLKLI